MHRAPGFELMSQWTPLQQKESLDGVAAAL